MRNSTIGCQWLWSIVIAMTFSCISKQEIPVLKYYDYDASLPIEDSTRLLADSANYKLYEIGYTSTHNKRVGALLTIPKAEKQPMPVVILLHGKGDRKTVDYIEYGHKYLVDRGYAVLRIDIANHGVRKEKDYKFSLTGEYRFWTRDIITQTVFDLRRAIDLLETRDDIDANKIGYYGISLGGIIGTIFCGVDDRVKAPVIALAGGNLSLMFGLDALKDDTKDFFSIIDPINFVERIHPRPFLMINSENDEIIDPITSKLLFSKANEPKEIKWYPSKHRDLPIDKAFGDGVEWYKKHL